jgi:predicted nucleic acid-binding protein
VKEKKVFDSFALLVYLNLEGGYRTVKDLLSSKATEVLINEINLGEVFYILARGRGLEKADYFLNTIYPSLPLREAGNAFRDVLEAARIKARYAISYADCFAAATALREKAPLVTGDPEFKKLKGLIEIDWL